MKRFFYLISFFCLLATAVSAQQYVVLSITGKVEVSTGDDSKHELALREKVSPGTVLNIPFKAQVELLDEQDRVKYTLKAPGRAALSSMLADRQNSVLRLTEQYLSYLKTRLKGGGELTSRRHSDPATVTREVAVKKNEFEEEYEEFRKQARAEYEEFRQKAIQEYADFVRKAWREFGARPARPKPVIEEVPPVVILDDDLLKPIESTPIAIEKEIMRLPRSVPQPVPVTPILEQKKDSAEYVDFMYYGTPLRVRFTNGDLFALSGVTPDSVADAFNRLAGVDMNNTIRDCLELRIRYQLSDWAYLLMLDSLSQACLQQKNEATLLMAYLYQQSGYKMRLGVHDGQLGMVYATNHHVYGKSYFYIDREDFYAYGFESERMTICEATYPNEQAMSLMMSMTPMLAERKSENRTLRSARYEEMDVTSAVNENLVQFYNDYPTSMVDGNFLTRWGMYANTPLDASVSHLLLPELSEKLKGLSKLEAVERLLNWIQTGFEYEYDDKVWGGDRAFFAEESLYYPYCDCEDRSILLSRLVRDLLGLKVLLVYYPGHLATAVSFGSEEVAGDYVELDGHRYVVCDPTYIGGRVGQTMPSMDNQMAKVLLLE